MNPVWRAAWCLVTAGALVLAASVPGRAGWPEGEARGRWQVVFTGFGKVTGDDREVLLAPATAAGPGTTHAALVVTDTSYPAADLEVTVRTERQLRGQDPNPWEVGWVLWNYTSPTRFYAVALKPNGWEVTKQDPAYPGAQRFLATGTEPRFPVGRAYRVRVTQSEGVMSVTADGTLLTTVEDDERPYAGGAVGLYTEDAAVRFRDLTILEPGGP